jgi:hypothetical protein
MSALSRIARRVEEAEVRFRNCDLDADIYEELGYDVTRGESRIPWRHRGHGLLRYCSHWEANQDFTSRVDAAKFLWPNGWYIRVTEVRFGLWRVEGWQGDKSVNVPADVEALAPSEAQARTAAALRAYAKIG